MFELFRKSKKKTKKEERAERRREQHEISCALDMNGRATGVVPFGLDIFREYGDLKAFRNDEGYFMLQVYTRTGDLAYSERFERLGVSFSRQMDNLSEHFRLNSVEISESLFDDEFPRGLDWEDNLEKEYLDYDSTDEEIEEYEFSNPFLGATDPVGRF